MLNRLTFPQLFTQFVKAAKKLSICLTRLAFAVIIGICLNFFIVFSLLFMTELRSVQASSLGTPLGEILTGTVAITHTSSTTHQMHVFADGRITDQYLNENGRNQIGNASGATTIAVMFDQPPNDNVDVGAQGEFVSTTPITLNTDSIIPAYSEDSYTIYASQVLSYQITQRTLATTTHNCVVMELVIKNTGNISLTQGKLLYRVDIDAAEAPIGDEGFYDPSRRLVYLGDEYGLGYAMGISLLQGNWRGYGVHGDEYATEDDDIRAEMNSPTNAIINGSNNVVWLVANIPDLNPNQAATLAFGLCARTGANQAAAQAAMLNSFDQLTRLSVSKTATPTGGSVIFAGEPLTYNIILSNRGYYQVSNVVITDTIPAFTGLVSRSISQGSIVDNNGLITATIERLEPTSDTVVTLVVTPSTRITSGTIITNQAFIKSESVVTVTNVVTHQVINDDEPTISINNVEVTEGNSGLVNAVFTVSLSDPSSKNITLDYATLDGTARAPGDYEAIPITPLTFTPGLTSQLITVTVNGDTSDEDNENFFVNLANPINATPGDMLGVGTIIDDDPRPRLSITDTVVTEGSSGTVSAVFTATLSNPSSRLITVEYSTADGTAQAPKDYIPIPATLLTFPPGVISRSITVTIQSDTLVEDNKTFFVNLNNLSNAIFEDDQGQGTIIDDDPEPTISINNVEITEGNSNSVNAVFTVSLSNPSSRIITLDYATLDGTACAPGDYKAIPTTTLTFTPGLTAQLITVTVKGDTLDEGDETFFVNLANPINATPGDMQGVGTISDDKQILIYLPVILKNPTICTPYGPANLILTNPNKTLTFRRIVDYANRYTIEVKVPANSDIEYGLSFGHLNTTPPMYYRFGIIDARNSLPARFRLKWQKGEEATQSNCLTPDGGDPCGFANNTINPQSNHLRIECNASTVKLYLNGLSNPVWQRNLACDGGLGIFLQSKQTLGPVTGHFTDFRISCPPNTNQLTSGGLPNAISTGSNSDLDH